MCIHCDKYCKRDISKRRGSGKGVKDLSEIENVGYAGITENLAVDRGKILKHTNEELGFLERTKPVQRHRDMNA